MKGRNAQVSRILTILDLLEKSSMGLSVSEIHEKLEGREHSASKRTIYRDLEALAQAGFPLFPEGEDENNTRWKLEKDTKINQYFALSAKELFALFLARGALTPLQSTPFYQDLEGIFTKLEDKLGQKQIHYLKQLESEMRFEPGPAWGLGINPEILETIRSGCAEGQVIEGLYYSVNSQTEKTRKLGPHYLYYAQGGLYLVAEDLADQKVKVFALPRFKSAIMLDEPYNGKISTPDEFFDGGMAIYNGTGPEEILIEFDSQVSFFVRERRWHPSQRVVQLEQGKIQVHFELGQTPELVAWILGFGSNARVLKPDSLAKAVTEEALKTASIYQKK